MQNSAHIHSFASVPELSATLGLVSSKINFTKEPHRPTEPLNIKEHRIPAMNDGLIKDLMQAYEFEIDNKLEAFSSMDFNNNNNNWTIVSKSSKQDQNATAIAMLIKESEKNLSTNRVVSSFIQASYTQLLLNASDTLRMHSSAKSIFLVPARKSTSRWTQTKVISEGAKIIAEQEATFAKGTTIVAEKSLAEEYVALATKLATLITADGGKLKAVSTLRPNSAEKPYQDRSTTIANFMTFAMVHEVATIIVNEADQSSTVKASVEEIEDSDAGANATEGGNNGGVTSTDDTSSTGESFALLFMFSVRTMYISR
eukprot:gene12978-14313_t